MSSSSSSSRKATLVVVVLSLMILGVRPFIHPMMAAESLSCSDIAQGLLSSCQEYVTGDDPPLAPQDSECCSFVTNPNVFCVCDLPIPAGMVNETALNKVIDACGLKVPPEHSNCAGFHIGGEGE
ncbi:hypothetical protein GOP47_0015252 [Adiantum capillus-veneris]|uniref:Bifunctional inhibitor/plant lipid transfer protein/seed storage helical domain-containing protein n=1 Tax=Adiantum capillus-veneris TaxID=13818 RepID=A0A9D4ZDU1_ADICA|nr:hypothetical protein GOP47_0015252 [Adiantum capillus-veneris]